MQQRRIATVGMFDGVHSGHRLLIERMIEEGHRRGLSSLALTFSIHPLSCICPERVPPMLLSVDNKRKKLIATGVDEVEVFIFDCAFQSKTAREFMELLHNRYHVDVIMMGFNNRFGSDRLSSFEEYREVGKTVGVEVLQGPEYPGVSSTIIRNLIENHDLKQANAALGYRYFIEGDVVAGKKLGRTIGYPTANISIPDSSILVPPEGVYVANVLLPDGQQYGAMVNIGRRPTVDVKGAPRSIEVHLFDFAGDIYGQRLVVEFINYIRGEHRFDSIEALVEQLHKDEQMARAIVGNRQEL